MPSESLWRRSGFLRCKSPLVGALNISPFSNASVPSRLMIGYAGISLLAFLMLAVRRFGGRDL